MTDTPIANEVLPETAPVPEADEFTELPLDVAKTIFRIPRPPNVDHMYEELSVFVHKDGTRLGLLLRDRVDDDFGFVIFAAKEQRCGQLDLAVSIPTREDAEATMRRWMVQRGVAMAFKKWLPTQEYSENSDLAIFAQSVTHDEFWSDWPTEGHLERLNAYVLQYKKFGEGAAASHVANMLSDAFDLFLHLNQQYR